MQPSRNEEESMKKAIPRSAYAPFAVLALAIALVFAPCAAWAADTVPAYGWYANPTSADTYTLRDGDDWLGFVELVNGTADVDGDGKPEAADAFAGKTVKLVQEINLMGAAVKPAGGQNGTQFDGTLSGSNNMINNFTIDISGGTENIGLIGYAGANSRIEGVSVGKAGKLTIEEPAGGSVVKDVGMLVGHSDGSIVECANAGSLTIKSAVTQTAQVNFLIQNVGGIAGICLGDVIDCANAGAVTIVQTSSPRTENEQSSLVANVGGIVGSAGTVDSTLLREPGDISNERPESIDNRHGVVKSCANMGTLKVDTPSEAGLDRFGQTAYAQATNIGGIAGYSRGSIMDCTNSGELLCERTTGLGGIVGGLRSRTQTSGYSGNFSSEGFDDGDDGKDPIVVGGCTNKANTVKAYVFPGGIVGRAGTYTTITNCINDSNVWIVALRWNKPFPAGICGSTYGTISYCANLGNVIAAQVFTSPQNYTTSGGYYAAGICGGTSRFTDANLEPTTPMPEVYGCYNAGKVLAIDNMRQRGLVGDNAGFVHDNLALEGCVSSNDLVYGDDANETETSGGQSKNNAFVNPYVLRAQLPLDRETGETSLSVLNAYAAADGFECYWVTSDGRVNNGYPVLNRQVTWDPADISSASVVLVANAEYTGREAQPKAKVTLVSATGALTELIQDVDFRIIPQEGAVEVTDGAKPYTATIEGVGNYAGTVKAPLKYGIDRGDLANCSVTVAVKTYNGAAQEPDAKSVEVKNLAGETVDSGEYTFQIDPNDKSLTDGKAVNARKYKVIVSAVADSKHFVGSNDAGVFNIRTAGIICQKENDTTAGNRAEPDGVLYQGATYPWFSQTQNKDAMDDELTAIKYTGHPILPSVTGVTLRGTTVDGEIKLVQDVDYRVIYGDAGKEAAAGGRIADNVGSLEGSALFARLFLPNAKSHVKSTFLIADLSLADPANAARISDITYGTGDDYATEIVEGGKVVGYSVTPAQSPSHISDKLRVAFTYEGDDGVKTRYSAMLAYDAAALLDAGASGATTPITWDKGGFDYGFVKVQYIPGGNYSNYEIMKFLIVDDGTKLDLADAEIKGDDDIIFEPGEPYEPIQICYGGSPLTEGVDYTIEYANNDKVGTATFTARAVDGSRFTGTKQGTFKIVEGAAYEFTYEFDKAKKNATVTGMTYKGARDAFPLVIPSTTTRDGATYTVTAIADRAFGSNNATNITVDQQKIASVTIPATVTSIGDYAFCETDITSSANVARLSSITFEKGSQLKTIGEGAFRQTSITSLEIPASVESIGKRAFARSMSLTSVTFDTISGSWPKIDADAFQHVMNVYATYATSATAVDTYVTTTIKSQNWVSHKVDMTGAWIRLWGNVALDTMSAIVDAGEFEAGGTVMVARDDDYYDALTAAGYAGLADAPVLLTNKDNLSAQTRAQIDKLKPSRIVICGGTAAVTRNVESQLKSVAPSAEIVRAWGPNAVGTAENIAETAVAKTGKQFSGAAFIATQTTFHDALAAAPVAYALEMPVFLANFDNQLDSSTIATMKKLGIKKAYVAGGTAALPESIEAQLKGAGIEVAKRFAGENACDTSQLIAKFGIEQGMSANLMGAATRDGYWDALCGAALCGHNNSVLVLVADDDRRCVNDFVARNARVVNHGYIFGGEVAVSTATAQALEAATATGVAKTASDSESSASLSALTAARVAGTD